MLNVKDLLELIFFLKPWLVEPTTTLYRNACLLFLIGLFLT
jgi:hypothetical protein